jgi:hypothetical protein
MSNSDRFTVGPATTASRKRPLVNAKASNTVGPIAHEWLAKDSVVGEAGADAITLFDHVLHHNFRVGKCVEVVPKECFNARRARLYVCVVVVVLRVDELLEEFNPFFV